MYTRRSPFLALFILNTSSEGIYRCGARHLRELFVLLGTGLDLQFVAYGTQKLQCLGDLLFGEQIDLQI